MKRGKCKKAKSQQALASMLGKTQQAVSKYLKDPRWNLSKSPPWDVAKVKEWIARFMAFPTGGKAPAVAATASPAPQSVQNLEAIAGQTRRAECVIKTEAAKLATFERELREGKYMLRTEVNDMFVQRIQCVTEGFDRLTRLLPEKLAMQKEGEISEVLGAAFRRLRVAYADYSWLTFDPFSDSPKPAIKASPTPHAPHKK